MSTHPIPAKRQGSRMENHMSESTPTIGRAVYVHDPLGYSGTGYVEEIQQQPTAAIRVRMETITDRTDQSAVGRSVWVLASHVTVRSLTPDEVVAVLDEAASRLVESHGAASMDEARAVILSDARAACDSEFGADHDHDPADDSDDGHDLADALNRDAEEQMLGRPLFPNEY